MASLTTRISKQTHSTLRELAKNTGQPMQSILDKAVDEYHRRQFWRQVRQSYAALRKDPRAWKE
jgi:predicted transcriptional regulator